MLLVTIAFFLLAGLYVLCETVRRLWLMEWNQMHPAPIEVPPEEEKKDEGPKLTKLGRPITEIKLSA